MQIGQKSTARGGGGGVVGVGMGGLVPSTAAGGASLDLGGPGGRHCQPQGPGEAGPRPSPPQPTLTVQPPTWSTLQGGGGGMKRLDRIHCFEWSAPSTAPGTHIADGARDLSAASRPSSFHLEQVRDGGSTSK